MSGKEMNMLTEQQRSYVNKFLQSLLREAERSNEPYLFDNTRQLIRRIKGGTGIDVTLDDINIDVVQSLCEEE